MIWWKWPMRLPKNIIKDLNKDNELSALTREWCCNVQVLSQGNMICEVFLNTQFVILFKKENSIESCRSIPSWPKDEMGVKWDNTGEVFKHNGRFLAVYFMKYFLSIFTLISGTESIREQQLPELIQCHGYLEMWQPLKATIPWHPEASLENHASARVLL